MALIDVQGLTRSFRTYKKAPGFAGALKGLFHRDYETVFAVRDVSFRVEEGEFVGFLGPNGAGKTTTLKMLAGLLHPTSGTASVLGYVPWERADGYRRQFALLLGQKNQLWWDLPARDSLELNGRIYGLEPSVFERRVDEMGELLGVRDKLSTAVRELSLGERMKCELIAALLHEPRVLFLDEPTIGLDVVSQKVVRDFLREHNRRRKTTILLTSHYMADIQELCDRVVIIDRGTVFLGVRPRPAGRMGRGARAGARDGPPEGPPRLGDPDLQGAPRPVAREGLRGRGGSHRGGHPPGLRGPMRPGAGAQPPR